MEFFGPTRFLILTANGPILMATIIKNTLDVPNHRNGQSAVHSQHNGPIVTVVLRHFNHPM